MADATVCSVVPLLQSAPCTRRSVTPGRRVLSLLSSTPSRLLSTQTRPLMKVFWISPKLNKVPSAPLDRSMLAMRSMPVPPPLGCAVQPAEQAAPLTRPGFTAVTPLTRPVGVVGSGSSTV